MLRAIAGVAEYGRFNRAGRGLRGSDVQRHEVLPGGWLECQPETYLVPARAHWPGQLLGGGGQEALRGEGSQDARRAGGL